MNHATTTSPVSRTGREKSLQVEVGYRCQNNCLFCCDGGSGVHEPRPDPMRIRGILERNRDQHDRVVFTRHEPTLTEALPDFAAFARGLGYPVISVITNGCALHRGELAQRLAAAGVNDLQISLHGHTAAIHDRITRRPGSFDQVMSGLAAVREARVDRAVKITLHSTISALNIDHLPEMIDFALSMDVDHYGLNAMFLTKLAALNADVLAVRYSRIVDALQGPMTKTPLRPLSITELPPCVTIGRLPEHYVGLREDCFLVSRPEDSVLAHSTEALSAGRGFGFRAECAACATRSICDGIPETYIDRFGWDEFQPVPADAIVRQSFESRAEIEQALASPSSAWSITDITLEPRRAQVHVQGNIDTVLTLLLEPLNDASPAYRRTGRYNVTLKGTGHTPEQIALADALIEHLDR